MVLLKQLFKIKGDKMKDKESAGKCICQNPIGSKDVFFYKGKDVYYQCKKCLRILNEKFEEEGREYLGKKPTHKLN